MKREHWSPQTLPLLVLLPDENPRAWLRRLERRCLAQPSLLSPEHTRTPQGLPGILLRLPLEHGYLSLVQLTASDRQVQLSAWNLRWLEHDALAPADYHAFLRRVADYLLDQVLSPNDPAVAVGL